MVLRRDVPVWVLPGGGIDDQETPNQCAIRETKEETGLDIALTELAAHYTPQNRLAAQTFVFLARPLSFHFPEMLSNEVAAVRFFPIDSLPKNVFFLHKIMIEEGLSTQPKPIRRALTEITWKNALKMCVQHPLITLRYLWTRMRSQTN